MTRGPDFFIVGAPKCGTTAMADYLAQHQELGMAARKETHFLVGDLAPRLALRPGPRLSRDDYMSMFATVQDRRRLGEASVWYLYSPTAAREIERFCPEAQIIIMLRNPVEMLPSLHSEFVHQVIEPVDDFETALSLDEERIRSGTPTGFPPHSYRDAVRYAEQVERYLEVFGRERVHVIIYDDFRDDPLAAFRSTCEFLGVNADFAPEIKVVNPNRRTRSRHLQRLVRKPPPRLRALLHSVTSQSFRRRTSALLRRLNRTPVPRDPLPAQVAESLRPEVEREVAALGELLDLDLSRWLSGLAEAEHPERLAR
jgi:hypothetical protein